MRPDPELNDRQRKFVEAVARGLSAQEAAKSANYSPAYARKSSRLLKSSIVAKAIAAIRTEERAVSAYGLVEAMKEAESAANIARVNKNSMALVRATELRAKLSDLLIDRLEEVPPVDLKAGLFEARTRVLNTIESGCARLPKRCLPRLSSWRQTRPHGSQRTAQTRGSHSTGIDIEP